MCEFRPNRPGKRVNFRVQGALLKRMKMHKKKVHRESRVYLSGPRDAQHRAQGECPPKASTQTPGNRWLGPSQGEPLGARSASLMLTVMGAGQP